MGSYTKEMHRQMDEIHAKIVDAHRRGVCDKDGRTIPRQICGFGHLRLGIVPFGEQKLNLWPRDEKGVLVDD